MTQYTRQCFQTSFLKDVELKNILQKLCVHPDKARAGDILAVVYPFATKRGVMKSQEAPSRVLWLDGNRAPLTPTWYYLVSIGLDHRRTKLIAQAFNQKAWHWCLNLAEQMAAMSKDRFQDYTSYNLLLTPDAGVLVRNDDCLDEDFEEISDGDFSDPNFTDAKMQSIIDRHSAIAISPFTSQHARLEAVKSAQAGSVIANLAMKFHDPRTFKPITPEAVLP